MMTDAWGLSRKERVEEGIAPDAPDRVAVGGIPPGDLMTARWCTMLDAILEIGQAIYHDWTPSILDDKPDFPYPTDRALSFVSRRLVAWYYKSGERSWDIAFGAYAILCQALAEGVVRAVAEALQVAVVPPQHPGDNPRSVYARERVAIAASEWRRDAIMMSIGMVRGRWAPGRLKEPSSPPEPPWVVLIERETLADFLERYADVLTEDAATAAAQQRGRVGRPRGATLEQLEQDFGSRWDAGEWTSYVEVRRAMREKHDISDRTARTYCEQLGICDKGRRSSRRRRVKK